MRRVPLSSLVLVTLLGWALLLPPLDAQPRAGAFTALTVFTTLTLPGVISPAAITTNQNDYNPAGLSDAYMVRLNNTIGGSLNITGIAGGVAGRHLVLCNVSANGASQLQTVGLHAGSVAANRFRTDNTVQTSSCSEYIYDGVSSQWQTMRYGVVP